MDPFTIAAIGMTAASAANSYFGGQEAARRRRRLIDEQARRIRMQHDRTISLAQATGAASGIEYESQSLQTALNTMTSEFRSQEDLFRKTGYQEAKDVEQAGMWNAFGDIAGGLFALGGRKAA
jgi:hypothetical protein